MIKYLLSLTLIVSSYAALPAWVSSGPFPTGIQYNRTNMQGGPNFLSMAFSNIYALNLEGVVNPTGFNGRNIKDALSDVVSVKWFGAVGDGVTDDTTAIMSARNFASLSNRALYFPSGNYLCSTSIAVWPNGSIYGDSMFKSCITLTTTNHAIVNPTNSEPFYYFYIGDIMLNSTATSGNNAALYMYNISDLYANNLRIFRTSQTAGFLYGVYLTGDTNGGAYRNVFHSLYAYTRSNNLARAVLSDTSDFGYGGNSTKIFGGYIIADGGISCEVNRTTDFTINSVNFEGFPRKAVVFGPQTRGSSVIGSRIEIAGPGNASVPVPYLIREPLGIGSTFPGSPNIGIEIDSGASNNLVMGNYTYAMTGTGILNYNPSAQNTVIDTHSRVSGIGTPQGLMMFRDLSLNNEDSWQLRLLNNTNASVLFNIFTNGGGLLRIWPSGYDTWIMGDVGAVRDWNGETRHYAINSATNAGATAALEVISLTSAGRLVAFNSDYPDARLADNVGWVLSSNTTHGVLWAPNLGQEWDFYAGDGTLRLAIDSGGARFPTLTADRLMATDSAQNATVLSVTTTEAGYLSGVTNAIQTQLNAKTILVREVDGAPSVSPVTTIRVNNGTLTDNGGGDVTISTGGGGSGYSTVQEEGAGLTARSTINFIGSGVTAVDNGGSTRTDVTVTRSGLKRELWIPASQMLTNSGGSNPDYSSYVPGNPAFWQFQTIAFDDATDEFAEFTLSLPSNWDGGAVKFKIYWTASAGTPAQGVVWRMVGFSAADNEFPLYINTNVTVETDVTDTLQTLDRVHITSAVTLTFPEAVVADEFQSFRIGRNVLNVADTKTGDALLLGVKIQYTESTTEPSAW